MVCIKPTSYENQAYDNKTENGAEVTNGSKNGKVVSDIPEKEKSDEVLERGQWGSRMEFILSCVGLSIGIGNIWRFPYLAYQNGGGAFVLPYIILMFLVGKPLYYLELAMGQFCSLGPLGSWRCLPVGKGVALAQGIISLIVAVYYNVILSYTIFYMVQSFRSELPWTKCHEWFGATPDNCYVRSEGHERCSQLQRYLYRDFKNQTQESIGSAEATNYTELNYLNNTFFVNADVYNLRLSSCTNASQTASQLFWENHVLQITDSIADLGSIRWELVGCLFFSWAFVFVCLMKGVKSSGKVVYFSATFPYVLLIAILIRGLTLPGAFLGIKYFLLPDWSRFTDLAIWRKAAEQLFFSLGVCQGGILMFGSYNKFRNPVHQDALLVSTLDFFTSMIGGSVIFSILGNMSLELDIDIKDVAKAGQGLAFVAYPEALARLPLPQLWTFLFFFMLFLLGIDTEFALLETILTMLYDKWPRMRNHKELFTFIACMTCFLLGIPCVTQGGQYVLNLMDTYGGGFAVIFIGFCEIILLAWFYGVNNLAFDIKFMLGHEQSWYWKSSWIFFSPIILGFLFFYGVATHEPITYDSTIVYPKWADNMGLGMALFSMLQIPLWAFIVLWRKRKNIKKAFEPTDDWGPAELENRLEYQREKENSKRKMSHLQIVERQ